MGVYEDFLIMYQKAYSIYLKQTIVLSVTMG